MCHDPVVVRVADLISMCNAPPAFVVPVTAVGWKRRPRSIKRMVVRIRFEMCADCYAALMVICERAGWVDSHGNVMVTQPYGMGEEFTVKVKKIRRLHHGGIPGDAAQLPHRHATAQQGAFFQTEDTPLLKGVRDHDMETSR